MRRLRLPSLVILALASTIVIGVIPAAAVVTSGVEGGVLTVTSDADSDVIVVGCTDEGQVSVNGADPDSGPATCAIITSIVVMGGPGDDTVNLRRVRAGTFSTLETVTVDAGDGEDRVTGSQIVDTIAGGADHDVVIADPSAGDILDGGDGGDQAEFHATGTLTVTDDEVTGMSGTVPFTSFSIVIIRGSRKADQIDAGGFSGWLQVGAGRGDDHVIGGSGTNQMSGDRGDDVLVGGPKADVLYASAGDDVVRGKGGRDSLFDRGGGADLLSGGTGSDSFWGMAQRGNIFRGGPGSDVVVVDLLGRSASLTARSLQAGGAAAVLRAIDRVALLVASSEPVRIDATRFHGRLTVGDPGSGDDVILGGSGRDELQGGGGDDVISGGPGGDLLDGGDGTDRCDGGSGKDKVLNCE
jgi:Ca2+-binding RTX toxin-like protein